MEGQPCNTAGGWNHEAAATINFYPLRLAKMY